MFGSIIDSLHGNAIAFRIPVGDIVIDIAVDFFEKRVGKGYRSCAINIVITVNKHLFPAGNGVIEPVNSGIHILHQKRIVEVFQIWPEKFTCQLIAVNATL